MTTKLCRGCRWCRPAWRSLVLPNAETITAMEAARRGEGKTFATLDELFADLNSDTECSVMKLCKDCRWAEDKSSKLVTWWICRHRTSPQRALPDYIRGEPQESRPRDCTSMRDDPGLCGPDGRYWEQVLEISGNVGFGEALAEDEPEPED